MKQIIIKTREGFTPSKQIADIIKTCHLQIVDNHESAVNDLCEILSLNPDLRKPIEGAHEDEYFVGDLKDINVNFSVEVRRPKVAIKKEATAAPEPEKEATAAPEPEKEDIRTPKVKAKAKAKTSKKKGGKKSV